MGLDVGILVKNLEVLVSVVSCGRTTEPLGGLPIHAHRNFVLVVWHWLVNSRQAKANLLAKIPSDG